MFLDPTLFVVLFLLVVLPLPRILEACVFWFGPMVKTTGVIRPDPTCPVCRGDGWYLHHGHCVLPCIRGCSERKPQTVMHWHLRQRVQKLAIRMRMDEKKAQQFTRDFENLVNSYLGPPIPCFVKTDHGWKYEPNGKKAAS